MRGRKREEKDDGNCTYWGIGVIRERGVMRADLSQPWRERNISNI